MTAASHDPPVVLIEDIGRAEAEVLRGLLVAQGISAVLSQEAIGFVVPVDVGAFGQVAVLIPASQQDQARRILTEYQSDQGR